MAMNRDDRTLEFGPYRLDLARAQLWREGEPVRLRPKSWEMLCYLAERPGVLVPFDVLLDVVWPGIAVTPKVLTNVIGELRKALCDEARTPQVIETIHRRGYRFIAPVATRDPSNRDASAAVTAQGEGVATVMAAPVLGAAASLGLGDPMTHGAFTAPPAIFVGRAAELETLGAAWQMALRGHRQVVFVTGEPGIGKTGLLDTFVHRLHADARGVAFLSGRGQSVEKFGAHEPFRPVLEILNELASGGQTTDLLRRYAPSWLVQIPWLLPPAEIQALREALAGIGSARMLREGCAFLEALSREVPLLLVLEDIHWSDPATMDFVSLFARRTTPTRVLLIATYRPGEAPLNEHPIGSVERRALRHGRQAQTVSLSPLPQSAVEAFLAQRFGGTHLAARLGVLIERHTAGHPLFLVAMSEHLVQQGWVELRGDEWVLTADLETVDFGLPDHLREIVGAQMTALPQDQFDVVEVASVAGLEFTTQAVAAGLVRPQEDVELACEQLARRGRFLRLTGMSAWPDGSLGERYTFNHALYQLVLYDAVAPLRRRRLHRRIAERLEQGYGDRAGEIASELAQAYVAAHQPEAAARVLELAAGSAARRFAYREAAEVLQTAIAQLHEGPDSQERARHEGRLHLQLGNALMAATSLGDRRVLDAFFRSEALCQRADAPQELFRARLGRCMGHLMAGDIAEARAMGERLVEMTSSLPRLAPAAHSYSAAALMLAGEFVAAQAHLERATASAHEPGMFAFIDLNVLAANLLGIVLTRLGFLDQGRASVERAVARSRKVGNPYDRAQALCFATEVHLLQRDASAALEVADEAAALARENGFHSFLAVSRIYQHALRDGPPEDIQRLLDDRKRFGEHWNDSRFLAILAEQHLLRGAFEAASRCLDDALVRVRAGERYHEAEIYRLQGEVFFARASKGKPSMARNQRPRGRVPPPADVSQAEACFRRSIDIARSQQAKLLELRGAVSLGRLLESRRETRAARQIVGETLDWFREGLHATDLRDARTLLEQLAK